jgi:formylglycine-generating enzyme required for sulfatase activity/tRNA A-37 threonylcarbamoyl transferase component Bud32/dienelactone hydrolase
MALAPGTKIGPYVVESLIGQGGMGEVYAAQDARLHRRVAIKIVPAHLSFDEDLRARFEREAKSISALQHPNICVIHDIGSQDGVEFMVMEYVKGPTLDKLIPKEGLPADVAVRYAIQIADAIACAHAAGIVHRDLKPTNIIVDQSGLVKVLDFGLAKVAGLGVSATAVETIALGTTPGMIVGTVAYMSPEQAQGKKIDERSDIFSFGAVFYEMLSGHRAFEGESSAALLASVLRDEPKSLTELRHNIPSEVRRIVARCLKKDPAARYASGAELARDLKTCRETLFPDSGTGLSAARIAVEVKRPRFLIPALLLAILVIAGAGVLVKRSRDATWARSIALPEISQLYDQGKFGQAFALATKAEKAIPGDAALAKLWPVISYDIYLETSTSGVDVYRREYADPAAPWEFVGKSPLNRVRQPRGMFVWKFEKPGYGTALRTTNAVIRRYAVPPGESVQAKVVLHEAGQIPTGMVLVSPQGYIKSLFIPGYEGMPELELPDYWIDQCEVTNRQFKAFVDAGGYQKQNYWKNEFVRDGKRLSWQEAMAQFKDAAGRPGPKDWIGGQYPKGQDDYPVTGVSWYEAAAYAEFSGKSLPTIYHWNRAAGPNAAAFIVPASNFSSAGGSVLAVGSKQGMGPWGTYDMAGNVKEWIWTEAESGKRYVLGGAWDEPNYMFIDPDAQSPFLRAANIGFRCVKYIAPESVPKVSLAAMPSPRRELSKEKPVADAVFNAYRGLYSYDNKPLNAMVEPFTSADDDWKIERITYDAPYGGERAIAYLFLPAKGRAPYHTVLYYPGSNALNLRKFNLYPTGTFDAVLRSGRAVIFPVYKSTFERGDGMESDVSDTSSTWRDHVVMWAKDASRAIDYVESRPDLDHEHIAFYGVSWGAVMGSIIPAIEPRIKVSVLALGGLDFHRSLPEADAINFLPRIRQPTLMLNGKYDFFFPVQSTQDPFYQLLGAKQKKHLLYESGHVVPRNELIKETLNWLDEYAGPVQ